jgi:MFS family permease
MPGGAIVDSVRSERRAAAAAVTAISVSAAMIALSPSILIVFTAQILHAGASCVLGPAIAAISLGLVGHEAVGERLGRNARFASIGNALAAAGMGACGYLLSNRSVFLVTALLGIPTLLAIARIREADVDPESAHGGSRCEPPDRRSNRPWSARLLLANRPLVILALSVMLFTLGNAAMLPLVGSIFTMRSAQWATMLVAASIVIPQVIVAVLSPHIGRRAQQWGRRPILLIGLAALPVRGLLFALVGNPYLLVAVQLLDGIAAAALGVLVPLIIADATRGTGRFNLAQGAIGSAMGVGASISTTLAGYLTDSFGSSAAFLGLAGIALAGVALAGGLMPETRPAAAAPGWRAGDA